MRSALRPKRSLQNASNTIHQRNSFESPLILNCKLIFFFCYNGATCTAFCDDLDALTNQPRYTCACLEGFEGRNCSLTSPSRLEPNLKLVAIIVPIVAALLLIALVGSVVFVMMARNKRATRGTYSPSRQEMFSPRVEMGQVMKPPPEERLI